MKAIVVESVGGPDVLQLKEVPIPVPGRDQAYIKLGLGFDLGIKVGGPDVLQLKEVPIPVPGRDQVLIKVHAAGVNACDTYCREGNVPGFCTPPYIPGGEVAGIVHNVGQNVSRFRSGDRVYSMGRQIQGAYAEFAVYNEVEVFHLHADLTYAQGAGIGFGYFTAHRALLACGQAKPGDTVLVHGASGAVGVAACQIANANGMTVLGTAGSQEGMEMILKNGAHKAFNHKEANHYDQIRACAGDKGVQVILEMAANKHLQDDLQLVSFRGTIVSVGGLNWLTPGGVGSAHIDINTLIFKEAVIRGVLLIFEDSEMAEIGKDMDKGMKEGWLRPQINRTFPLADAAKAHVQVLSQQDACHSGSLGKLVLVL